MEPKEHFDHLNKMLKDLKQAADRLALHSKDFPALNCNLRRIQSSIKMLEINIGDACDLFCETERIGPTEITLSE